MKIVKNGNFTTWVRLSIFLGGVALGYIGLAFEEFPNWLRLVIVLFGFLLVCIGGISTKAHTFKIQPFGESSWNKAKKSYEPDAKEGTDKKE